MTHSAKSCGPETNLAAAAMIMWDTDCGVIPVVDGEGKVLGMLTDRDICMATATKHRTASAIMVREILSGKLHTCTPEDDIKTALTIMQSEQVHRLPVVNSAGVLQGILSMNDLVLRAEQSLRGKKKPDLSYEDVMSTLKGICAHR